MDDGLSILLPYQRRWIADRAQVKVAEKSRRIGLTWTEAADRALGAAVAGRGGWTPGTSVTTRTWRWSSSRPRRSGRAVRQGGARDRGNRSHRRVARHPCLPDPLRLGAQDRRALVASVEPARQAGLRGYRRGRVSRRSGGPAESRARVHDVGRVVRIISTHNGGGERVQRAGVRRPRRDAGRIRCIA